jgi:predicted TIM-barrel fold metal-dependent hydrolase
LHLSVLTHWVTMTNFIDPSSCLQFRGLGFSWHEERVLFGSDASVDGPLHYCRRPPNVEGQETYNEGLVPLIRHLGAAAARGVLGDNARRLFRLNGDSHSA